MFTGWKRTVVLVAAALAVGLLWVGLTTAGKPKPPAPPPPGKIVFQLGASDIAPNENWEMNADGTGKVYIAPGLGGYSPDYALGGTPSAGKYDAAGGRWFLKVEESEQVLYRWGPDGQLYPFYGRELFAYGYVGGQWTRIQVTNIASDGYQDSYEHPQSGVWSNDGLDSFVSIRAHKHELDGNGYYLPGVEAMHVIRLHVSGLELGRGFQPISAVNDARFEIVMTVVPSRSSRDGEPGWEYPIIYRHHWDPTGTKLVYILEVVFYGDYGGYYRDLFAYVRDLTTWEDTPIGQNVENPFDCRWSPQGDKIVLNQAGALWTVNPDGTGLVKLLDSNTEDYYYPFFSPDGQWLVYRAHTWSPKGTQSWIRRVPVAGGSQVNLTNDTNKYVQKYPEGWFAQ